MTSWLDSIFSTSGAPLGSTYITVSLDGTLTAERALGVAAGQITKSDGGAGGSLTLGLATTAVTAGEYALATVTVDDYGRVTAASAATDIELPAGGDRTIGVAATSGDAADDLTIAAPSTSIGDDDGYLHITDGSGNEAITIYTDGGAHPGAGAALSFFGETPVARQDVLSNASVADLITVLDTIGLINRIVA
jgi:hypothetical protein